MSRLTEAPFSDPPLPQPDWAAVFRRRPLGARPVIDDPSDDRDWTGMIRRLGALLEPARRPHALAAIVVRPVSEN